MIENFCVEIQWDTYVSENKKCKSAGYYMTSAISMMSHKH